MSIFLERLSIWNMLNWAEQVQIQKYKTHAYQTLETVCVQIIILKHPTKHIKKLWPHFFSWKGGGGENNRGFLQGNALAPFSYQKIVSQAIPKPNKKQWVSQDLCKQCVIQCATDILGTYGLVLVFNWTWGNSFISRCDIYLSALTCSPVVLFFHLPGTPLIPFPALHCLFPIVAKV